MIRRLARLVAAILAVLVALEVLAWVAATGGLLRFLFALIITSGFVLFLKRARDIDMASR